MNDIIGKEIDYSDSSTHRGFSWTNNEQYNRCFIEKEFKHLSDVLHLYKYLSWERICVALRLETSADEIESMKVLRYEGMSIYADIIEADDEHVKFVIRYKERWV